MIDRDKAYSEALSHYCETASLDAALAKIEERRNSKWPVPPKEHMDEVEFFIRAFWASGRKERVYKGVKA